MVGMRASNPTRQDSLGPLPNLTSARDPWMLYIPGIWPRGNNNHWPRPELTMRRVQKRT